MDTLKRWLPFMFKREKGAESSKKELAHDQSAVPIERRQSAPAALDVVSDPLASGPWFSEPMSLFADLGRWFGDFAPRRFLPTMDVVDEADAVRVSMELPGMTQDDVKTVIDGGGLVVRGEKHNRDERRENGVYRTERFYGAFERRIPLPDEVDPERAEAHFERGVLTIRVPKRPTPASKSRQIAVGQ